MPGACRRARAFPLVAFLFFLCSCADSASREEPRLLVVISVDQLRADLLTRYDSLFTGGLRRLLDDGRCFTRAVHDHAITNTAPGHATLATGVVPARHGIVDNRWYERVHGEPVRVASVADSTVHILGEPSLRGISPHKMLASSLANWVVDAHPRAQVVSIGGKSTSATLLAGRARGHVYWFSSAAARFVTSSWYRAAYPEWLERFHAAALPRFFADSVWTNSVPAAARAMARPDSASYEGFRDRSCFPHRFADRVSARQGGNPETHCRWWCRTPMLDQAILALAEEAVRSLSLGQDASVDLLALGLSQVDVVGHQFGPWSLEQLDTLLRLDRALGDFFAYLEDSVGEDRYVVGFSGDHGVSTIPEYLRAQGRAAARVSRDEIDALLGEIQDLVPDTDPSPETAVLVARRLEALDWVADAMTHEELAATTAAEPYVALYRNSYHPERALAFPLSSRTLGVSPGVFGVEVRLEESTIPDNARAVHGSPYFYDRHVPLIFMGAGVAPGPSRAVARTVDFAPTLARLAGIPIPDELDGQALPVDPADVERSYPGASRPHRSGLEHPPE